MGGGKGSSATIGYRYYMKMHMGLCRGPIDELVRIKVGDMEAWPLPEGAQPFNIIDAILGTVRTVTKDDPIYSSDTRQIRAPNLFGGDKKEGGIEGSMVVMMGRPDQTVASYIKSAIGGLVSDFRGVATIFYDGLLCSLNPYPKSWAFRVRRVLQGWDGPVWQPSLASIWLAGGSIQGMNAAHILYECFTNREWGRGLPRAALHEPTWLAAAQTLYNEGFGLCIRWNRQQQLGDFMKDIIDHIGGGIYNDRTTGQICLSLLRGNYDLNSVPLFTYDSGLVSLDEGETISRDDMVNEIVVNWHDPIENKDRQARVQNLASIQSMGATKSNTVTYSAIPVVDLALRVAQRDLKVSSTTLKRYKVILDRRASRMVPGSVFRISAPEKNIGNAVLRAGAVRYGTLSNGRVEVEATVDVFGLPSSSFVSGQDATWTPPDRSAVVASAHMAREGTYAELIQRLSPADLALVQSTSGAIAVLAGKPTTLTQGYRIASKATGESYVKRASGTFDPIAVISSPIGIYDTTVSFQSGSELGLVQIGTAVQVGDEICRVDDIQTTNGQTGTMTIARGCVDTIPAPHTASTKMFFFGSSADTDAREYALGEEVSVKVITTTSTQELDIDLAPVDTVVIAGRHALPWPPANVKVNGVPFGTLGILTGDLTFSWAHRDRTLIQDQLKEHGAPSIGPETGAAYNLRIYPSATSTTPIRTFSYIDGSSVVYTAASRAADGVGTNITVELESIRSGLKSQFKYRFAIRLA